MLTVLCILSFLQLVAASCPLFSSGGSCDCQAGFFMDPRTTGQYNSAHVGCSPCESGSTCAGGTALPVADSGYFTILPSAYPSEPRLKVIECPGGPEKCLGHNKCYPGYIGIACNTCSDGYQQYGTPNSAEEIQCQKCMVVFGCVESPSLMLTVLICLCITSGTVSVLILVAYKFRVSFFNQHASLPKEIRNQYLKNMEISSQYSNQVPLPERLNPPQQLF